MLSWPGERLVLGNLRVVLAPGLGGVSRQPKRQLLIGWYYSVILVSARGWFSVVIKSSVSLREDQHAFAKALVVAGRFLSVSAVLQQGLYFWRSTAGQIDCAAPMSDARWTVAFAAEAINDLLLITEHLTQAYCGLGEPMAEANRHAQLRIESIIAKAERLAVAPLRGESRDDLLSGLRYLALDHAAYWFRPRAEQRDFQVLAVFFGGQDHQRRMLVRLL